MSAKGTVRRLIAKRYLRQKTKTRRTNWNQFAHLAGWSMICTPLFQAFSQSSPPVAVLKPHQKFTLEPPPQAPTAFNPDSGQFPVPFRFPRGDEFQFELRTVASPEPPPLSPGQFNPDPGAGRGRKVLEYTPEFRYLEETGKEPIPADLELPRQAVRRSTLGVTPRPEEGPDQPEVPDGLKLPRNRTRYNESIRYEFKSADLPTGTPQEDFPPYTFPQRDRWRVGFSPWRRYTQGSAETPYETPVPRLWHPYKQSVLKGDVPVLGQDIFLNLTASSTTEFEARRLPTPSGVSAARPNGAEFFGR